MGRRLEPCTMTDEEPDVAELDEAVHDIGGRLGFGAVPYEPDEPAFHADWERRVFGIMGQTLARSTSRPGEFRHAIERLSPDDYYGNGYYGRWEATFEVVLEESGVIAPGEVDRRLGADVGTGPAARARPVVSRDPALMPMDRPTPPPAGRTVRRELADAPRFAVGDRVVATRTFDDGGHTRLPAYVEGRSGTVAKIHPAEVLPDSTAHDLGERAQHVYCVAYDGEELWGAGSEPGLTCHVDLYENYLSPEGSDR